jgi:hypothetical protein
MKKIYNILYLFVALTVSCTNNKSQNHFLDFKLGMNNIEFTKVKDSLENNEVIKWENYNQEWKYEHEINFGEKIVRTALDFKFEYDELSEIEINIGNYTKPHNWAEKDYFFYFYIAKVEDVYLLYDLYESKYGEPTNSYSFSDKEIKNWEFKDYVISFNFGEEQENSSFLKNAYIQYYFSDNYKDKKKIEFKEKYRKENLKNI